MKEFINKYIKCPPHERSIYSTNISIVLNILMFIGKVTLSFIFNIYFLISGIINLVVCFSKIICLKGINKDNKYIKKYNKLIGLCLMVAGLFYSVYMMRLIFTDIEIFNYNMVLGITIALVSFIELSVAIIGIFRIKEKGNYYINIKLINISTALTAISLTELALMSFAYQGDSRFIDGLFGVIIGFIILLIGIYILISFKYTLVSKEYQEFYLNKINDQKVVINLYHSKIYSSIYYEGNITNSVLTGFIKKSKSPIFDYNIFLLIIVLILSEILIFPFAIGALINHFKGRQIINKLNEEIKKLNS